MKRLDIYKNTLKVNILEQRFLIFLISGTIFNVYFCCGTSVLYQKYGVNAMSCK